MFHLSRKNRRLGALFLIPFVSLAGCLVDNPGPVDDTGPDASDGDLSECRRTLFLTQGGWKDAAPSEPVDIPWPINPLVVGARGIGPSPVGDLVLPVETSLPDEDFDVTAHVNIVSTNGTASLYPWPASGWVYAREVPAHLEFPPVLEAGEVYHALREATNVGAHWVPQDNLTWFASYPSDHEVTPLRMVSTPPPAGGPISSETTRLEFTFCL